ncbi:hypothetical protein FRB94_005126 [Tulasnella sp. JGI-2019a]|nr:hypothetical protein FRB93_005597 [Tulasnella sp. JGI-2019a]KAG9000848.1 hypothetical protein FRB94_005126 [Tulasnella sp. JGI-2019a]KAG9030327.1 hypothetical protein FRB95_004112 [Tulasnella sp. JGI-2019a]
MLAVAHHQQPTMYVQATTQPSYYYVQAQPTATVPAGQWTAGGQQVVSTVNHSGSAYVYANPGYRPVVYQQAAQQPQQQPQQTFHHGKQTFTIAPSHMQIKAAQPQQVVYAQPPQVQRTYSGGSVHSSSSSRQNSIPVSDAGDFVPVSPVMSEATTMSDDSSSSSFSSASASSRYNLPSSAINHYTAPSRERPRRNSFVHHQQPSSLQPQPYGIPSAGQSSLSLPPPQVSQPIYGHPSQQLSHPSIPTSMQQPQQPVFVRNTGRSDHPVNYHPNQNQQVYSSFELYKPSPQQQQQQGQHHRSRSTSRPVLTRRASTTQMVPVPLTSSSYGTVSMGGGPGMGMGYGGERDSGDKKWWKLGR